MRKRNVQIVFRLTKAEAEALNHKVKQSGLNRETFIRKVLEGYTLKEKPDERFYEVLNEMRAIGRNLNQIAAKANVLGFVDQPLYEKEAQRWRRFEMDIRRTFLVPE